MKQFVACMIVTRISSLLFKIKIVYISRSQIDHYNIVTIWLPSTLFMAAEWYKHLNETEMGTLGQSTSDQYTWRAREKYTNISQVKVYKPVTMLCTSVFMPSRGMSRETQPEPDVRRCWSSLDFRGHNS